MSHNIIQDIQDILWNIYDIFFKILFTLKVT